MVRVGSWGKEENSVKPGSLEFSCPLLALMCSKMTKSILGLGGGTSCGDSRTYSPKAGFR